MDFQKLANLLKALSDPTRLQIVAVLQVRDCCTCELTPIFGISQPAMSKHMSRLKQVDLVKETRKGQWVFYTLNHDVLKSIGLWLNRLPDQTATIKKLEEQGLLVQCDE